MHRIKQISSLLLASPSIATGSRILSTISSDGFIHLYDLSTSFSAISSKLATPGQVELVTRWDSKGIRLIRCAVVGFKKGQANEIVPQGCGSGSEESESDGESEQSEAEGLEVVEGSEVEAEEDEGEWGGIARVSITLRSALLCVHVSSTIIRLPNPLSHIRLVLFGLMNL